MSFSKPDHSNYKMTDLYLALALTLIVVLITYLFSRKFRKSTNLVLLTGLSDSGKTAIFSRIIFNKPKKSVTSLKENEATINEFNLKLVDLPGAERLRSRYWEQYRTKVKHVLFLVDSTTIESRLRDLSEYLYVLLSDEILYKNKIRFTIACNKQDLEGAKKKDSVRLLLEKELNAIRDTRKGQLGKTSDEETEDYLVNLKSEELSFESLGVDFIESSVHNPEQIIKLLI